MYIVWICKSSTGPSRQVFHLILNDNQGGHCVPALFVSVLFPFLRIFNH